MVGHFGYCPVLSLHVTVLNRLGSCCCPWKSYRRLSGKEDPREVEHHLCHQGKEKLWYQSDRLGRVLLLAISGPLPTCTLNLLLCVLSAVLMLQGEEGNSPRPSALLGQVSVVAHSATHWVSSGNELGLVRGRVGC